MDRSKFCNCSSNNYRRLCTYYSIELCDFDVPSHSIVIGNPAKIINQKEAIRDYVNRKIKNEQNRFK